jgi:hypothetical protein
LRIECKANSQVAVDDSKIDNLYIAAENRAVLTIEKNNQIKNLYSNHSDSSRIYISGTLLQHGMVK